MKLNVRLVPSIGVITALALMIRVMTATWTGLTTDETNGVMIAISGSWQDMLQHLRDDGNAPLFYAIVREYTLYCGHSGFALKGLAIAIATASVPVAYWLFRRVLPKELCLSLALLLAFCPTFVCYGTLVRPYGLAAILGLFSTFACMAVLSPNTNKYKTVIYGVTTALLVYTHYWAAFVPIGQVGLVLIGLWRRWFGWRQALHWFAGAVLALLLFMPQIYSVLIVCWGLQMDLSPFDLSPRPLSLACDFITVTLLSRGFCDKSPVMFFLFLCNLLVVGSFVSPKVMTVINANSSTPENVLYDGRMWKTATICGLWAAFWMDFTMPSLRYRYLMPFVPMIFVVFVTGANALFANKSVWLRVVTPCLIWLAMFIPYLSTLPFSPETTAEAIVGKIIDHADRKKDIVLVGWEIIAPTINFYLPEDIESISYPHMTRSGITQWTDMTPKVRDSSILPQLFEKLQKVLDRGGRIWFVDEAHHIRPLDYRVKDLVANTPFMEATKLRTDQIRSWLVTHSQQEGITEVAPGRDFSIIVSVFAPVGKDAEGQAALPKPDSLWRSVNPEESNQDESVNFLHQEGSASGNRH